MSLVVLASAIWMAVDASQLGYDKRDIRGLAAMGPVGWFFAGLLLWIVAFPLYLVKRGELKAAGEFRRQALAGGPAAGFLPQGYPPQGYPPQGFLPQGYPPQGYPPANQPTTPLSADEVADRIVKLGEMRDTGLLTEIEFQQQKALVLARMG